ncbi:MAG TPA: GAF domain-containing protein, partial [Bryobacteraceae bacterium]|nr:GAF domain-containing protein [Bryobacteraceae bacterium]
MAARAAGSRLIRGVFAVLIAWATTPSRAAERLTFEEIAERRPGDYAPRHVDRAVIISGVVALGPTRLPAWVHAAVHDERGRGVTLESNAGLLDDLRAGDRVEIEGTIGNRGGLAVIIVQEVRKLGHEAAPAPIPARVSELASPARLGTLVAVEAPVIGRGENAGGEILTIGNPHEATVNVFLPRASYTGTAEFARYRAGDRVRVVGLSSQYCPVPPYNRAWQIVVGTPQAVSVVETAWIISPGALLLSIIALVTALAVWWWRERHLSRQRQWLRALTGLAEDVVSASTPAEIARTLASGIPRVFQGAEVRLYLFNRSANTLDPVAANGGDRAQISVNAAIGGLSSGVALCFRNRALLSVPDAPRSPLFEQEKTELPATALFVPMITHQEVLGVLSLTFDQHRKISRDEQAAVQHVANQVAISLKLEEQKHMREQLLRSERMAATGQLISGVAAELRVPLNTIRTLADDFAERFPASGEDLTSISYEAERAGAILSRLVSFANPESTESQPVDVNAVLATIVEFRRREWETRGFDWQTQFAASPLMVIGVPAQIEQVLLNLLVAAESVLERSAEKKLRVLATAAGDNALLTIDYSSPGESPATRFKANGASSGGLGLQVCRAILQTHGGELRIHDAPPLTRLEIEIPLQEQKQQAEEPEEGRPRPSRQITALIVEPEVTVQRRLMALLAERGHRSVPVSTAEDGLDLSHRLKFDVVFCAVRLAGLNWVELRQKVRRHVP